MEVPSPPLGQFVAGLGWRSAWCCRLLEAALPTARPCALALLQRGRAGAYRPAFLFQICGHVKGGEKVYHCGGGIVYHRHDEKRLNWEPGGVRSGAGVRRYGVSQEWSGSSETWEATPCRLWRRR